MGLVQELVVSADTREQLIDTIRILLAWNKRVTHYITGVNVENESFISLLWGPHDKTAIPLLAPMDNAEHIALQLEGWLKTAQYKPAPQIDGSTKKGWRVVAGVKYEPFYTTVLTVTPEWIEYHK